jgi:hypothetical protein
MKAGLISDIVHVPDTWATWRIHSRQATAAQDFTTPEYFRKIDEMIHDAVSTCEPYLPPAVKRAVRANSVERARELRAYYRGLRQPVIGRRLFQLNQMLRIKPVRREILGRVLGLPKWSDNVPMEIRQWLESLGLQPLERCSVSHTLNSATDR